MTTSTTTGSSTNSVLYTKSLSNDSFELVEFLNICENGPASSKLEILTEITNNDDTDVSETIEFTYLTEDVLESFFDADGRIVHESKLRKAVFNGGCIPSVRRKVWSFLFGLYPMMSTERERKEYYYKNYFNYYALKEHCFKLLSGSRNDFDSVDDCVENSFDHMNLDQSRINSYKSLAEIYAEKQKFAFDSVDSWFCIVDKDLRRTDINHPYFSGHESESLKQMRNILITFGFFHPEIGYLQGMNDILTRFLIVLESEADAYWCFSNYMESVQDDYSETGMVEKIQQVCKLLKDLEPNLFSHFNNCSVPDLFFCHRWLIVSFSREFEYEDSIRYFEMVHSQHLKFDSHAALSAQDDQYKLEVMKTQGQPVPCPSFENVKYTLDMFVCVSVMMLKRQEFLACTDTAEVFGVACNIRGTLDLEVVHRKAYSLFMKYCRQYIRDHCAREGKGFLKTMTDSLQSFSDKLPSRDFVAKQKQNLTNSLQVLSDKLPSIGFGARHKD